MATVLGYSLIERREQGATREDVLRACVRPGLVPNAILASMKTVGAAEHVWLLQGRYLIRDNPGNAVATQARRELQRDPRPFQKYVAETSIRDVFGGAPLVYSDLAAFEQRLSEVQPTLNPQDAKFVICTRRLKRDERQTFFQGRAGANLFMLIEPIDGSYDALADGALLFEAAKAVAANRLTDECRTANLHAEVAAYRREYEAATTQIKERLQGAFGRTMPAPSGSRRRAARRRSRWSATRSKATARSVRPRRRPAKRTTGTRTSDSFLSFSENGCGHCGERYNAECPKPFEGPEESWRVLLGDDPARHVEVYCGIARAQ
jgi:hypothetical protein